MPRSLPPGSTWSLPNTAEAGAYIRVTGSDIAAGDTVLEAGTRLGPTTLGILAGLGIGEVAVTRRPSVLLLSTGDELVAPGESWGPDRSTTPTPPCWPRPSTRRAAPSPRSACSMTRQALFTDSLRAALASGERGYHLVISSGGISKGAFDVVKEVLATHGVEFGSVAMQPGGPQGSRNTGPAGLRPRRIHRLPRQPGQCLCQLRNLPAPRARRTPGTSRQAAARGPAHRGHGIDAR